MANFYEKARTNYFRVKDPEEFKNWCKGYYAHVEPKYNEPDKFCLLWDEDLGFQEYPMDSEGNDLEGSFFVDLPNHLAEDAVCIVMVVGSEKYRYLTGWAIAIDNSGYEHMVSCDLDKIYDLAEKAFPNKDVNSATY